GHRPYQGRAPHGPQLSQGTRRRPHQCCARRRRLQLWPPPALARRAFARPVAGALHNALGSTTGLKPAAPSYFTSDDLMYVKGPQDAEDAHRQFFRQMAQRCYEPVQRTASPDVREQLLLWAADFNANARSAQAAA